MQPCIQVTAGFNLCRRQGLPWKASVFYADAIRIGGECVPSCIVRPHPLPYATATADAEMCGRFRVGVTENGIRACHVSYHDMYHEDTRVVASIIMVDSAWQELVYCGWIKH